MNQKQECNLTLRNSHLSMTLLDRQVIPSVFEAGGKNILL